jgi:hypothetical protein
LGQRVEVRQEVDADRVEIRWAGELVAAHRLAAGEIREVWDGEHFAAAQAAALGRHRRHLALVHPQPEAATAPPLELPEGDYDVGPLDLGRYALEGPDSSIDEPADNTSAATTEDGLAGDEAR